jgi:predicted enzyme related to lactoylglutathione lyase
MPEYAPGTPSWIDLGSPDPDASAAFYGALFGWQATEAGPVEETGGYRMFQQDGGNVGGLMALQDPQQPPAWSSYVSVTDADAIAAAVREHGGTVMFEPMDVMDLGRMAFFADPGGAALGIWQPKSFPGADLVNVPVSLTWNELRTHDVEGAKAFYASVFGWEPTDWPETPGYAIFNLNGNGVAGLMDMGDLFPPDVPPHWGVVFAVADTDATAAQAQELGAQVVAPPADIPVGRFAGLIDPQGAGFAVIRLAEAQA